ncbi:phosphotransferase enzyme family protein [Nonomuraea wenchangensis]|uniref:phosphotransferase enzyme family protein n=1 Tax=Nonomuraea wenchangensis TaxID=568860 RepID=UPI0034001A11
MTTSAAVSAAVAVAREHGVRVAEPVLLHDSFNLRVHLRPAPVVARVPTVTAMGRDRPDEVLRRELEVVSHLHRAGAPVVPPSDLLPPGPHLWDGFAVTFWTYAEHDPERVISPEEAGRGLAELHEALRGFPGELPVLWPALDEPARLLGVLDGRIDPGVHARLRAGHEELAGRLPRGGGQAVHGDAHPGNLLATPRGLLWNDFEECMTAPVAWDLAVLGRTLRLDGRAALRAYGVDPDDPALAVFRAARALQGTLWQLVRAQRLPRYEAEAERALTAWLRDPSGARR